MCVRLMVKLNFGLNLKLSLLIVKDVITNLKLPVFFRFEMGYSSLIFLLGFLSKKNQKKIFSYGYSSVFLLII